jgi:hypothetical protein
VVSLAVLAVVTGIVFAVLRRAVTSPSGGKAIGLAVLSSSRWRTITALLGIAVVAFVAAAALDQQSNWGNPRQAAANVSWIVFVLCAVTCIVLGVRAAVVRRSRATK